MEQVFTEADYEMAGWIVAIKAMSHAAEMGYFIQRDHRPQNFMQDVIRGLCSTALVQPRNFLHRTIELSKDSQQAIPLYNASIITERSHATPDRIEVAFLRAAHYLFHSPTDDTETIQSLAQPLEAVTTFYLQHDTQKHATISAIQADDSYAFPRRISKIQRDATFFIGDYSSIVHETTVGA